MQRKVPHALLGVASFLSPINFLPRGGGGGLRTSQPCKADYHYRNCSPLIMHAALVIHG